MTWRKIAKCEAGACVEVADSGLPDDPVVLRSSRAPEKVLEVGRDEWDAFLAGLRATESGERGEVVGEAAGSDVERISTQTQHPDFPIVTAGGEEAGWTVLRDLTVALAGRLLPPVVQTREEWRAYWGDPNNDPSYGPTESEEYATSAAAGLRRQGWPDVRLERRTISAFADDGSPYGGATLTSAWREVSGDG